MALRIIEIVVSSENAPTVRAVLREHKPVDLWTVAENEEGGRRIVMRALVDPDYQQSTLDALHDALSGAKDWRIVVQPLDAAIPKPEPSEEERNRRDARRRSAFRDGIYSDVEKGARTDRDYLSFVALSTLVAGAALVTNNVAVLIGAMVIAPFLGPNLAFAFGAALGDRDLMREAALTLAAGFALTLALSVAGGVALPLFQLTGETATGLDAKELQDRTRVGLDGVAVALASGACAAIALTRGMAASLVGVMVAVALLPPAVAMGVMIGAGRFASALGAAELLLANIACVNLAALTVFRLRGIEPRRWLERAAAKQSRRNAFVAFGAMLVLLVLVILAQAGWLGPG